GFMPLGIYWETMPGKRVFHEYVFVRRGEPCYGLLYPADQILPRRAAFLTAFPTGGVVFTKNNAGGLLIHEGNFISEGAGQVAAGKTPDPFGSPDTDLSLRIPLADVFERHRENVNRLLLRGEERPQAFETDDFVEVQRLFHEHPVVRREFQAAEKINLDAQIL